MGPDRVVQIRSGGNPVRRAGCSAEPHYLHPGGLGWSVLYYPPFQRKGKVGFLMPVKLHYFAETIVRCKNPIAGFLYFLANETVVFSHPGIL